jgi:hypothetical protein
MKSGITRKRWNRKDEKTLSDSIEARVPVSHICKQLGRTEKSIYVHAYHMGLHVRDGKKPHDDGKKVEDAIAINHAPSIDIATMSKKDCNRILYLYKIGGDDFFNGMKAMFPNLSLPSIGSYYTQRKMIEKRIGDRIAELKRSVEKPVEAVEKPVETVEKPVEPLKVPARKIVLTAANGGLAKSSRDVEALLIDLLNESRVQTSILSDIAKK